MCCEKEVDVGPGFNKAARYALLQQIAPQYQDAPPPQKKRVLEGFLVATGYARRYVIWLLNHAEEVLQMDEAPHHRYGPEVEQALVLAWQTLSRICAKRLIPFLPTLLASLEEHWYVQLSEESRLRLLSMSAATADRLLRPHRYTPPRGRSTTKAGPLLKQQDLRAIAKALDPVRLFHQVERLQQALFRCEMSDCAPGHQPPKAALVLFQLDEVTTGRFPCEAGGLDEDGLPQGDQQEPPTCVPLLNWRHTRNDPFVEQWEQICPWVQANPTRSSGAIFGELQSQFPGRYQPGHLRTLQRGIRKIRAHQLATRKEPRRHEVLHADAPTLAEHLQAKLPLAEVHPCALHSTSPRPNFLSAGETSADSTHISPLAIVERAMAYSAMATRSVVPASTP
jgi:hypothetical protein